VGKFLLVHRGAGTVQLVGSLPARLGSPEAALRTEHHRAAHRTEHRVAGHLGNLGSHLAGHLGSHCLAGHLTKEGKEAWVGGCVCACVRRWVRGWVSEWARACS
jgi:hypothetical protein